MESTPPVSQTGVPSAASATQDTQDTSATEVSKLRVCVFLELHVDKCLIFPRLPSSSAVQEFSFNSNSLLRFQLRGGSSSRRTNVQLLLRTRATSGILLYVASKEASEYIVLEVSQPLRERSVTSDLVKNL